MTKFFENGVNLQQMSIKNQFLVMLTPILIVFAERLQNWYQLQITK